MFTKQAIAPPATQELHPLEERNVLDQLMQLWKKAEADSFFGPVVDDIKLHIQSGLIGTHKGGAPLETSDGIIEIVDYNGITVYIGIPKDLNPKSPLIYVNHGGGVEGVTEYKKRFLLRALGVYPQGIFWAPGQIVRNFLKAGFVVFYVAGADIDAMEQTHAKTIWDVANDRCKEIIHWMIHEFPGHPLYMVGGSIGGATILTTFAAYPEVLTNLRGVLLANSAVQFTGPASLLFATQHLFREWRWGGDQFLPALLPGTRAGRAFRHELSEGLVRNLTGNISMVLINSVAQGLSRDAAFFFRKYTDIFRTSGTDNVVDPSLGGLGKSDALASAVEIKPHGIDHFAFPFHPQIIDLSTQWAKHVAKGSDLLEMPVHVNWLEKGPLKKYRFPENPLHIFAWGTKPYEYHEVALGSPHLRPLGQLMWEIVQLRNLDPESQHPYEGHWLRTGA